MFTSDLDDHHFLSITTLGGDVYKVVDWGGCKDLKQLAVEQHPNLKHKNLFDLVTYNDVLIDPKRETSLYRTQLLEEYYDKKRSSNLNLKEKLKLILIFVDEDSQNHSNGGRIEKWFESLYFSAWIP